MAQDLEGAVCQALDQFRIELPSWGFANTGSRFGKFMQPAAATNLAEKFSDAGMVNQLTGACQTVALHAIWDLPNGLKDVDQPQRLPRAGVQVWRRGKS
jgi:L-rhamnose isomerase/sugar isomerase